MTMTNKEKYQKSYNDGYYANNRAIINKAKDRPCAKCGLKFPVVCMDLHHRDPKTKSFGIGARAMSYGPKKITAEIAKCDVVCANCHRIIEHIEE